jgi:hypothetical protein
MSPTPAIEITIVILWLDRDAKKPDPRSAITYPAEIKKKKDPASPWLIPNSFSTLGSSGDRITLETVGVA